MNETLFLAEKILAVLSESNQTLESQRAATEIVVMLFKAEPYGSLAHLSSEQCSEVANQSRRMQNNPQSHADPIPSTEGTS